MSRKIFKAIVAVMFPIVMGSCVYDFVPSSEELLGIDEPMVVIEGDIIVGGTTVVTLKQTEHMLPGQSMERISYSGSVVWVEGADGKVYTGYPVYLDGTKYEVNTSTLSVDGSYRLCVSVPGRGEYHSAFKNVLVSPPIDTITCTMGDKRSTAQFEVSTHNDDTEPLYCRWSFREDWESNSAFTPRLEGVREGGVIKMVELSESEQIARSRCFSMHESTDVYIANTEKLTQNVISRARLNEVVAEDNRVSSMYALTVTQTALDKEGFKYWDGIKASLEGEGLFAPMPNEVKGNIVSATYPDEKVLGYISVSTASQKRAFFSAQQLMMYNDTACEMEEHQEIVDGENVWYTLFMGGMKVVDYAMNDKGEYVKNKAMWTQGHCVDCRLYSNSTRPDFWPYM